MASKSEIAIVGYACRVPGARHGEELWQLLRDNRCSVTWITPDRFPTGAFLHPAMDQIGRSYTFAAGVIDDVWGFDAQAFGMSPREAEQVDPQHRHLLEISYDALAHAGIRPSALAGSNTGVYVGASSVDHAARFFGDPSAADVHMMTGNSLSIMANRISYTLDLHGPSITLDTACSSSLVALHMACEAIRNGTIDTAIVAGVNLLLSPYSYVGFSRAMMLSPTGLCRPFDAKADGYVRAEGAIAMVLRSTAAAHKARDRIHAVIVGSGMNQDGRTTGMSLPSAESQRHLLEQVYDEFSVDPADLLFMEAHGTGTRVGDPIEADALGKGLGQRRAQPLPIGSIKSNLGHLEPVSGLAGLLKSILALNHGIVPATLHQSALSPDISFDELNLKVIDRNWRPPERRGAVLAGVNSFGFGGTNAHAIVRSDAGRTGVVYVRNNQSVPPLLLTAHNEEALSELAAAYDRQWPDEARSVPGYIGASAHLRDMHLHRALIEGATAEEIRHKVRRFAAGEKSAATLSGHALGNDLPVTFLFSGNGAQWSGMGRVAWQSNQHFREALNDVDDHFAKVQKWSIVDMLFSDELSARLRYATYSQPLLFALQVATVRALEEEGITPAATMGHSIGEISAAWAAGGLSLEQAIDVVIARSRHQEAVHGSGGMAAMMLSVREAQRFIKTVNAPGVDVAAINSWRSVTISGPTAELDKVVAAAESAKISARRLDLDYPFHSALVDAVRAPLLRELEALKPRPLRRKMISSVTGEIVTGQSLVADHWWQNVRAPVQFDAALTCAIKDGARLFLEIGPRPVLASYVRDVLREGGTRGIIVDSLREGDTEEAGDPIKHAIARILVAGGAIDVARFFGPAPAMAVELPLYPWQHAQFRVQSTIEANSLMKEPSNPLLGLRLRQDCTEWFSTIDPALFPWLEDHKLGNTPVFPAAGYVEVVLAAAREVHGDVALELRDLDIVRPLAFENHVSYETMLRLSPDSGLVEFLSRPRGGVPDWTLNARGTVSRSPITGSTVAPPVLPAGVVVVGKPAAYRAAQALGYDYGPAFQRADRISYPHPKHAVASLSAPAPGTTGPYVTDLTALDAAFHGLFASEEAGVADMPMKRMLPIRFNCVRAYKPGAIAALASSRTIRQSLSSILMDFTLYDAEGKLIFSAEAVRLVEASADVAVDPRLLTYRTTAWRLDRAEHPSELEPQSTPVAFDGADSSLAEALLLLEAGCLRAAWNALAAPDYLPLSREGSATESADAAPSWQTYYRPALLWYLEARGLAVERDGRCELATTCELPEIGSIVSSLAVRHPMMIAEAVSLSRIDELLPQIVSSDRDSTASFQSSHWRHLGAAANQIRILRDTVSNAVSAAIEQCDKDRLLRILLVGAGHIDTATTLANRFANVEIMITDADADRLDEARLTMGEIASRIRCVSWSRVEELPSASLDLAFSIDALSEIATSSGRLDVVNRSLRPGAPLIAGELTPSLFWDIVRGARPGWWARSATSEFPVGALLTSEEWVDELHAAGFGSASAYSPQEGGHIGVVIRAVVSRNAATVDEITAQPPAFSWNGDETPDGMASVQMRRRIEAHRGADVSRDSDSIEAITDFVWVIDAHDPAAGSSEALGDNLAGIAESCRLLADAPARLWILVDFGSAGAETAPLEQPIWCSISSAMRVAQNEYAGLQIRCLGVAGTNSAVVDRAVEEMLKPDDEREIFVTEESRLVFRIQRRATDWAPRTLPEGQSTALTNRPGQERGHLAWIAESRQEPQTGEVEIAVATTGLNFRDVMWNLRLLPEEALEDGFAGPGFGMECAGTIVRVGPGVEHFRSGDRVIAFAPRAFRSHLVVPSFSVAPLPDDLSFEAACGIPVAFLTAYYSLVHLGQLAAGETVLIHGGAGAVGLAAIQIARLRGAKIIASAGSEEKRAFLRKCGVDFVCNSRSLTFADDIHTYTNGKGVDVALNSLAGEAMIRTMACVRPFGRFIELGKRDFYANTQLGLRPLRRNLSYFGVDIDQLIVGHKDLAQRLFAEVIGLFATGELFPIPYRVFAADHVDDAFRLMQRAGHIGKIVTRTTDRTSDTGHAGGTFHVAENGLHIVIGGTGGFGLATAEWLAARGATRLLLASRSAKVSEVDLVKLEQLRRRNVEVVVEQLDVTDLAAVERLFTRYRAQGAIKGIVHAAMVLDDGLMSGIGREAIDDVLQPKVTGALNLERAVRDLDLDYLLLYSSATTLFGNPGQYSYVAANGFMEGMARRMRSCGIPALAVSWGGIGDAGYLARNISADVNLKKRFSSSLISAAMALDGLDWAFDDAGKQTTASFAVARIDWSVARRELAAVRTPTFDAIAVGTRSNQSAGSAEILERLKALPVDEAADALVEIVVEEIARVLRLPPKDIDRHRPLAEIGMDSLMMLELRNTVESALQVELAIMSVSSGITPIDVARRIAPLVIGTQQQPVPGAIVATVGSHFAAEAEAADEQSQHAAISAVLGKVRELDGSS
jgi:phthiocerol/phenolphthiocerol synthesis type-I polyketide synthase C